jgi:CheY-like chemotaxis protein
MATGTILNVDDHAPARFVRTRILERAGYGVEEVDSAALAIDRAGGASLVLLDVKLPDADGFAVCEQVKARYPDLPVVMVTSVYRTAQARRDGFAVGADAYLLEPLEPAHLVRTVDTFLKGGRRLTGTSDETTAAWAITSAVGQIEDLSPAAARLLNLSRRGAMGRSLPTFFVENRPELMAELMRAAEGVLLQKVTTVHPRDRRPRRVRIDVALIPGEPGERVRLRWTVEAEEREKTDG